MTRVGRARGERHGADERQRIAGGEAPELLIERVELKMRVSVSEGAGCDSVPTRFQLPHAEDGAEEDRREEEATHRGLPG